MGYVTRYLAEILKRLDSLGRDRALEKERKSNEDAYYRQLDQFRNRYPGEYVALVSCKLVDHDKDLTALVQRTERIEPDPAKRFFAKTDVDYIRKTTIL